MILGLALVQEGRIVPAFQAVNRALRFNPRSAHGVLASVAVVNYLAGRMEKVAELLERVRAVSPDQIIARILLVPIYEEDGHHRGARELVGEVLGVRPELNADSAVEMFPWGFDRESRSELRENLLHTGLP